MHAMSRLDWTWRDRMEQSYQSGNNSHPLRSLRKGSQKYTDTFDAKNPGGVLKYFCYAQSAIGNQTSYADLAATMNRKADWDGCLVKGKKPTFNTSNVYRWFKRLDGKLKSSKEKPMLTPEMMKDRKKWCKDMKKLIEEHGSKNFYACFLDEKWFYITSR